MDQQIQEIISDFLKKHHLSPKSQVGVFFVNRSKIHELNKKYRQIDSATDVLSFPIWETKNDIPLSGPVHLGDIFICKEEVNGDFEKELPNLVTHSLNHLIGKHH